MALWIAALEVVDDKRGLFHVLDIEPGLSAGHFQAHVEPDVLGDVDGAGEARAVVKLPVQAGVENRRVLHGVGLAGLVLAEVHPFGVGAVDAELNAEEAAAGGGCDIHIDDAVANLEVFDGGSATVEQQALAALVFGSFGLSVQFPARRIRWDGVRRGPRAGRTPQRKGESNKNEMSEQWLGPHGAAARLLEAEKGRR